MEIQTRRHILETWRAAVEYSYRKDSKGELSWHWGGGRSERNSISDAEQLLTILYPATEIPSLKIDSVDETAEDVLEHLRGLGNALDIPRKMTKFIGEYMNTYLVDGTPDFSGGSYFDPDESFELAGSVPAEVQPDQRKLHVVDSYSMSVTLCLATLGFLQKYRQSLRSDRMLREVDELEKLASQRLTAAMVGLLRSFTVNTFDPVDAPGEVLLSMVNQRGIATEIVVESLLDELEQTRARLRQELRIGGGQVADELENPGRLFECGWSWGVVDGAPEIEFIDKDTNIGEQPEGIAEPRPYLYFTVVALEGIQDLFSKRTRSLGLLNPEQQRLAESLRLRWDLTQEFWAKVATFGSGKWPLEDVPWTTTDGASSDYYSLLLTSIVIQGSGTEQPQGVDVERIRRLLEELANRGRITRRPTEVDPAIELHRPGMFLRMMGSEKAAGGPRLRWTVSSYSVLVLKRMLRVAELTTESVARLRILDLADLMWNHVERRRIEASKGRGLWDEPTQVFTDTHHEPFGAPSWYHTERVIEALVAAANATQSVPDAPVEMLERAEQLQAEAERLFDLERLRGTNDTGEQMRASFQVIDAKLKRVRHLLRLSRPGSAATLAEEVLRQLDEIDAPRQDSARMG